jgi:hypothetical protein
MIAAVKSSGTIQRAGITPCIYVEECQLENASPIAHESRPLMLIGNTAQKVKLASILSFITC